MAKKKAAAKKASKRPDPISESETELETMPQTPSLRINLALSTIYQPPKIWPSHRSLTGGDRVPSSDNSHVWPSYEATHASLESISSGLNLQSKHRIPELVLVSPSPANKVIVLQRLFGKNILPESSQNAACIIEYHLRVAETWSCDIVLRRAGENTKGPPAPVIETTIGPTVFNVEEANEAISQAQSQCQNFHSSNRICVNVAGPGLPNLYLHDLPIQEAEMAGLFSHKSMSVELAESYLVESPCLVLAIGSEGQPDESILCDLLQNVAHANVTDRTVGILISTESASLQPSDQSSAVYIPLKLRWTRVQAPQLAPLCDNEDGKEMSHSDDSFSDLGEDKEVNRDVNRNGEFRPIVQKIAKWIEDGLIQRALELKDRVQETLKRNEIRLERLAPRVIADPRNEIANILFRFAGILSHPGNTMKPADKPAPGDIAWLSAMTKALLDGFREELRNTTLQLRPWMRRSVANDINDRLFQSLCNMDNTVPKETNAGVVDLQDVVDLAAKYSSDDIPGPYPSVVRRTLIKRSIDHCHATAMQRLTKVQETYGEHIDCVLQSCFGDFAQGGLYTIVRETASSEISNHFEKSVKIIQQVSKREETPYVPDRGAYVALRAKYLRQYKLLYHQMGKHEEFANAVMESVSGAYSGHISDAHAYLGYAGLPDIQVGDLAGLLPDDEMAPALEVMADVRAYFDVATERYADAMAAALSSESLHKIRDAIGVRVLRTFLEGVSDDAAQQYLQEPAEVVEQRRKLTDRVLSLRRDIGALTEIIGCLQVD